MWRRAAIGAWATCRKLFGGFSHPFGQTCPSNCGRRGLASVSVTPAASLADQPAKIAVSGLAPSQEVTVRALVVSEHGSLFDSCAHYQANKQGEVDLVTDSSRGGDYTGLEPMGLFWSLSPATVEKPYQRLEPWRVKAPMNVKMSVHQGYSQPGAIPGQVIAQTSAERWFTLPGVRRIRLKEGVVRGSLFLPPGEWNFFFFFFTSFEAIRCLL